MFAIAFLFVRVLCDCFKARRRLEAEILVLRHQLNVLQQRALRRLYLTWADRALFVWLYRGFPRILDAIMILRPETIVRWHRNGFSAFWRWKSRPLGGRPQIDKEVRDLIRRMNFENPLWGAPHIHGELLKLGFDVAQSTVSKYMVPRRGRPSQTWKTFLRNHADGIASIDLYIVRDNDRSFGSVFTRRIQAWFRRLPLSNSSHFLFLATDDMCDDVPEALDRAPVRCYPSRSKHEDATHYNRRRIRRIRRRCSSLSTIR